LTTLFWYSTHGNNMDDGVRQKLGAALKDKGKKDESEFEPEQSSRPSFMRKLSKLMDDDKDKDKDKEKAKDK